ncbi:hypothetical protein F4803DRAFT_44828 [Xylaria telfairii]|nr:hypothetical protein F4803DRAFT_44828 [Xylaria telfairii]
MGSPTTKIFIGDFASPRQQKSIIMRAAYCNADNCYRALFPCPSPWIVTEAVLYCATVSAISATNYPTQAISACGTEKDRYISACSCPATNCPIGITSQPTTQLDTAQPVITTTAEEKGPSESDPTPIITPHQIPSTTTGAGVVPTQILNNGATGLDEKSSGMESLSEAVAIEPPVTSDASLDHVSSTHSQAVNEVKSVTGSQALLPSLNSLLPQSLPTSLGQSSTPTSSIPPIPFQEKTSKPISTGPSRISPSTTTLPSGSGDPSTPENGPEGLSAGLVAVIAVGATLAALLLLAAVAYYCLKRRRSRRGARLRARTLSQESMAHEGFDAPSEWKPPVELPHLNTATSRRAELEDSPTLRSQIDDASSFQATPRSPSATSSLGPRNGAEMLSPPPRPPRPSPAELFVLPAELPGVYKN